MANNSALKQDIRDYIYTNHNEEITGNILRDVLLEMVDTLGAGWIYKGVAALNTQPGTPDTNVFYLATVPGTYQYFKNSSNVSLTVSDGEVAIFKIGSDGSWSKDTTGAATKAQLDQLGQEVGGFSITESDVQYINSSRWVNNSGVIGTASSGVLKRVDSPILVIAGRRISITTTLSYATVDAAFFCDDSGNVIQTIARDTSTTSFSGVVPSGATKLYLNYATTFIVKMEGSIDALNAEVNGTLFDKSHGYTSSSRWSNNNGVIGYESSSTFDRINPIAVGKYKKFSYIVTNAGLSTIPVMFVADTDGNILLSSTQINGIISLAAEAAYVYFNTASSVLYVEFLGLRDELDADVKEIEDNLAKSNGPESNILLSSSDFEQGNISGQSGVPTPSDNTIRTTIGIRVAANAVLTYHTDNGYRISIVSYALNGFIKKNEWYSGDGTYQLPIDAYQIKIVIAKPSGQSGIPNFDDSGLTLSVNPGLISTEAAPLTYIEPLPLYAPSPQLPANTETDSDFNAETLTPAELYAAFSDLITKLPKPGTVYDKPKYAAISSKVGRDATNTFDIYAYRFGRANRFAYKTADGLFAWKNGNTIVYTDSISPRVGDTIYSSSTRADSGATVTSFDATTQQITSSASVTYTRSNSDNIGTDVLWTDAAQNISTPTNKTLYYRDGTSAGTGTATDSTHFTFAGKSYARCEELDYHTEQKMTIVLWGNEHGPQSDPAEPAIVLYRMAKDLCGGCRNNKFLAFLKYYCNIVMIPCVNPYGLQNHTRNNGNSVNINRNYSTPGWSSQADNDKGAYAGSESETQYVMNALSYYGADLAIDVHCLGYNLSDASGKVHYEGYIPSQEANNIVYECMLGLSVEYSSYGAATPDSSARGGDWIYYVGISGGLIEMNAGPFATSGGDGNQHTPFVMLVDYTLLLNTIRMWMTPIVQIDLSEYSIK